MSTPDPTFLDVAYRDLVPYKHAIWCSIMDGPAFANMVMSVNSTKDGRVSVGLDSHNFMHGAPDEIAPCVIERTNLSTFEQARIAAWKGLRPVGGPFDA